MTRFHCYGAADPEAPLGSDGVETHFQHLSRNFGDPGMPAIESRYQLSFERHQLQLFRALREGARH